MYPNSSSCSQSPRGQAHCSAGWYVGKLRSKSSIHRLRKEQPLSALQLQDICLASCWSGLHRSWVHLVNLDTRTTSSYLSPHSVCQQSLGPSLRLHLLPVPPASDCWQAHLHHPSVLEISPPHQRLGPLPCCLSLGPGYAGSSRASFSFCVDNIHLSRAASSQLSRATWPRGHLSPTCARGHLAPLAQRCRLCPHCCLSDWSN